ncbi:MAG: hypothetical protein ACYCV0_20410 [Desulfitobacteriaceae bacterium]
MTVLFSGFSLLLSVFAFLFFGNMFVVNSLLNPGFEIGLYFVGHLSDPFSSGKINFSQKTSQPVLPLLFIFREN